MSESSGPSVDDVMNAESVADIAPAVVEETAEPEPEPEVAEVAEVAEPEAPSTQEVVQNVQEMLSSTDTSGSVNELENRVKVLEERLEKLINYFFDGGGVGCSGLAEGNHFMNNFVDI